MTTRGSARQRGKHFYARARYGRGKRLEARVPWAKSLEEASARGQIIADVADSLVSIGRRDLVPKTAEQLAEASTPRRLERVQKAIATILSGAFVGASHDITVEQLATQYTSGELARLHPDHVKARNHDDDLSRLREYILKLVGDVPVVAFEFEHAQRVLSNLPPMSEANRRQVAQIMGRLMHLAVFPCKLIKASPLPRGWLPKVTKRKLYAFLYPREESLFLSDAGTSEAFRLFCGVLDREGMRLSELLDCEWWQWNLQEGTFTATKTKTGDPRMWAVRSDTAEAMRLWAQRNGTATKPFAYVLELVKGKRSGVGDRTKLAKYFRAALHAAGITRAELFASTEFTGQLRAHDMRATFVTISLAEGKSETWIRDRTAHKSTSMIDRYRRTARQLAELKVGSLVDLVTALGWGKGGGKALSGGVSESELTPRKVHGRGLEPPCLAAAEPKFGRVPQEELNSALLPGEEEVSRPLENARPHSSPTPIATVDTRESGTSSDDGLVAHGSPFSTASEGAKPDTVAPDRPGPARAAPRHDVAEGRRKLASLARGATALAWESDLLDEQAKAFDSDGES